MHSAPVRASRPSAPKNARQHLATLFSIGFAAKGIVYLLLGTLAVLAALGTGGRVEGTQDVLQTIAAQPFGAFLLGAIAVGLAAYAVYRLTAAVSGEPFEGEDHAALKRIGAAASGIAHVGLTIAAVQILVSGQAGGGGQTWIAKALGVPGGNLVIGAIGIGAIVAGLQQARAAYTVDFTKRLRTAHLGHHLRTWLVRLGRFGLAARAVVFPMIGVGLVKVAMTENPSQYEGLGASLSHLGAQAYGNVLLGTVALGLAAYGVYMLACAKYRRLADEVPS